MLNITRNEKKRGRKSEKGGFPCIKRLPNSFFRSGVLCRLLTQLDSDPGIELAIRLPQFADQLATPGQVWTCVSGHCPVGMSFPPSYARNMLLIVPGFSAVFQGRGACQTDRQCDT